MRKLILIFINLILAGSLYAASLTVRVRDFSGSPVTGAMVAVISFTSTGSPDHQKSDIQTTGSNGDVVFVLTANTDYMVFASKQGMAPTINEQMGPGFPSIRTGGQDLTIQRTLSQSAYLNSYTGYITCPVNNLPNNTLVFADVQNTQTQAQVAFTMAKAVSNSALIKVYNVPAAAAGMYVLNCGIPELGLGYPIELSSQKVEAGKETVVTSVSSAAFSVAGRVDRQDDEPAGNISFEGVVVKQADGTPIPDCTVVLKKRNQENYTNWMWNNPIEVSEVRTDYSGHFAFYDVPVDTYAVQVGKKGFEGRFFTGQNGQGILYNGTATIFIRDGSNGKINLPAANGKIKGKVVMYSAKDGNVPVPNANVNLWSDWSTWNSVHPGSSTCNNDGYGNYYTTGPARAANSNAWTNTNALGDFELDGLAYGNYTLAVNSDFTQINGQFIYNYGDDRQQGTMSDNLRVNVSSKDFVCNVYNSSSEIKIPDLAANGVTITISTATSQPGTIRGTITFDTKAAAVNIPTDKPLMIWAYQQNSSGPNQKRFFKVITGAISGKTIDYELPVSTGPEMRYWIQVKSQEWGIVGRMDMNADLTSQESISGFNFRLAPAGRLRGLVRLPDGKIFKRKNTNTYEERINIQASGVTVDSSDGGDVKDDGYFDITGLIPGTFNITTKNERYTFSNSGSGITTPLDWPNMTVSGVKIRAGEETYLEIQLKNGTIVSPKTPSMPSAAGLSYSKYGILKFPSSEGASRDSFSKLLGGKEAYQENIAFEYDSTAASDPWGTRRILPGRYDFVLSRIDVYGGGDNSQAVPKAGDGDHYCVTVIGQLKNVEINYDSLKPNNTSYLEFESGTLGMSELTGVVKGDTTFTQKDVDIITNSGMEKFFTYIPSVMLYDADGQLKAFSMALPLLTRVEQWDTRIKNKSFTLEWFKDELSKYPLTYNIKRLPAGQYVAVFETPNYPPMIKKVTLTSGANSLDVNFDDNNIIGSSIEGVVKSTDGAVLADSTIILTHRTVKKTINTDSNGIFSVSGLPPGTYRMSINKPGYAPAAEKFGLGKNKKYFNGSDAILLSLANSSITGTVYSQKMPMPKVIVGAKIVAYNETYNTQNPGKMLPVLATKTDEQGNYIIDGMIAGNLYKIYVLSSGKLLEWKIIGTAQNPLAVGANTGMDFVLRALPPRMKITMTKVYENGRFLYKFIIESPKKIINPQNPASLAAPYCRYSPVAGVNAEFDATKAVEVLPSIGPEISNPEGGKIYSYSLKVPVLQDNEFYKLRVQATDGINDFSEDLVFGPKIEARAKKDMKEEIAEGGDIAIDTTGTDTTQLTVDPGAFTPTGAETSSLSQNDVEIPIGGFLSSMPNFNLSRTGATKSAAMAKIVESIVASDVYEVALEDAQVNKSLSLNLKFDMAKVNDTELANLQICQFNGITSKWEVVKGAVTVDPVSNIVAVDVDSVENASGASSRSPNAGKSVVKNGMFAVNKAAASSQNGVFAVFKQDPNSAKLYTGTEFEIINFPNPFDLRSKAITMQDANSNINQTITGTLIKYSLPSANTGRIRIYIYNLAAELVKELDEGDRDGGYYYYAEWDGKNDNGEECASGVYFAVAKCDGKKLNSKPLKLAILK